MARTYIHWGEREKVFSKEKNGNKVSPESAKKLEMKKKFCRCKVCGQQMTYVHGTNTLICENVVPKQKTITTPTGETKKVTVEEVCGNINLVDKAYLGYVDFLFN